MSTKPMGVRCLDNVVKGDGFNFRYPSMSVGEFIFRHSDKYAENVFQIHSETGETETFQSVKKRSVRVALEMQRRGITSQDIVILCMYNSMDSTVPWIASQFLGATLASLDPTMSARDCKYLIGLVNPKMVFVSPEAVPLIEEALIDETCKPEIVVHGETDQYSKFVEFLQIRKEEKEFKPVHVEDLDAAAFILFSSGTTGLPKGITVSHFSILYTTDSLSYVGIQMDCSVYFTSFYWISAVIISLGTIMVGGRRVICPPFDPDTAFKIFQDYKWSFVDHGDVIWDVPMVIANTPQCFGLKTLNVHNNGVTGELPQLDAVTFTFLATCNAYKFNEQNTKYDTSSLKTLIFGGTPISTAQMNKLQSWMPRTAVFLAYGLTELAGFATSYHPVYDRHLFTSQSSTASGMPMPGISMKVVDIDTGKKLQPNERGEIRIKTAALTKGYHKESSAVAFDEEGFLKTGDIGFYDNNYCFHVLDRIKEMFKYQCWHIVPASLEAVLQEHPAVKESVVVGIPNEVDGDVPMAIVVLKSSHRDVTAEELQKFVAARVDDRQKLRGGIRFVETIPRTPSGKVIRGRAREMILNGEI